ncbi:MerR family transcriptional regulator [Anaerocolumna aminovalerica]|jgi:DNA-binding transcriptional MerR regulator|uniref:DNA-binding transcriptional regulator, MerR family n=1 Tax=Anaerocolumna aminovalerica TaxID=1527 RepID=A0A1I5E9P6_9FIRM|nr:MerR family transcriptional regulator [Anaerocolumna aminovalerica]MBU5330739.1 MerR family transcriptional regulator [Anaerocolumna aminovalerica]MDU6263310.1 MerR family transcriptional regulator [Anaerocolumna aminovalerica]SFO08244.1 DNA-binding transcriptional regulator, MerR family [Anaerocolumna aminovalerica]
MLKIGDFSKLSRISIRMLRHYNEIGLLVPKSTDSFTGYRFYSEDQLPVVGRINALKDMGFSLTTIVEILKSYDDPQALAGFLAVKQSEVQAEAKEAERRLLLLDTAIKRLRKDGTVMSYNVTLKELPERYVASVRKVIPSYQQEGMLWGILMQETAPLEMQDGDPCYTLAIFHDGEFKESNVDVEVQKSVRGSYKNTENVVFKTEPPVLIASATYKGSYEKVDAVNEAVANWVNDNGYDFNGLSFNIYHVSPHETQNPDEYVTEVCYPVKKK